MRCNCMFQFNESFPTTKRQWYICIEESFIPTSKSYPWNIISHACGDISQKVAALLVQPFNTIAEI